MALEPWTLIIAAHAVAAGSAIVIGGVQVVRGHKGDAVHRTLGRVWASLMLFLAAASFFFGQWSQPIDWFLRALAVWVLFSVSLGWLSARRGNIDRHAAMMVGNYIGLLVALGFVFVPGRLTPTWFAARPGTMAVAVALVVAVAATVVVLILRRAPRSRSAPGSPRPAS